MNGVLFHALQATLSCHATLLYRRFLSVFVLAPLSRCSASFSHFSFLLSPGRPSVGQSLTSTSSSKVIDTHRSEITRQRWAQWSCASLRRRGIRLMAGRFLAQFVPFPAGSFLIKPNGLVGRRTTPNGFPTGSRRRQTCHRRRLRRLP